MIVVSNRKEHPAMKDRKRTVSLRKLPNRLDRTHQKALYREVESCIGVDRPCVVLDCSMLEQLDKPVVQFLLYCLEEAMKRNGDIRLAALQPEVLAAFASIGLEKLFQVFDDVADAEESFRIPRIPPAQSGFAAI